ncbi:unnamed protein product [Prorocentrum cordatum]|uniref:Uncharacterized protein n=1 Tax=Prorocentrum cordatum TaxID=2364126 RepID=A0ABN9R501_9DINO|nr:unnamed protein product [Polarella glacialis]
MQVVTRVMRIALIVAIIHGVAAAQTEDTEATVARRVTWRFLHYNPLTTRETERLDDIENACEGFHMHTAQEGVRLASRQFGFTMIGLYMPPRRTNVETRSTHEECVDNLMDRLQEEDILEGPEAMGDDAMWLKEGMEEGFRRLFRDETPAEASGVFDVPDFVKERPFAQKSKQATPDAGGNRRKKQRRTVEALPQGEDKDDDVLGCFVAALSRLARTSAAELRDIAGIAFACLLLPMEGQAALAMKAPGHTYNETVQALKAKNDEKGLACEKKSKEVRLPFWMVHIKDKGAAEVQEVAMRCTGRPTTPKENKPGRTKLPLTLNSKRAEVQGAPVAGLRRRNGAIKRGPAPRGPLERAAQQLLEEFEGSATHEDCAEYFDLAVTEGCGDSLSYPAVVYELY